MSGVAQDPREEQAWAPAILEGTLAGEFVPGRKYSRRDVFRELGIREDTWGGNWFTGYNEHGGAFYVFANVGAPGRTGHDYGNRWDGERLRWFAKRGSRVTQPQIQRMLDPSTRVHIFWRADNRGPFVFAGLGVPSHVDDSSPVEIVWSIQTTDGPLDFTAPDEVRSGTYAEGAVKKVWVNAYERNPAARAACIIHFGPRCQACGIAMDETYGDLGKGFIHVHHLIPLSTVTDKYEIDAIGDLRPLCPNCHAMIHRREPALSMEELREVVRRNRAT